MYPPPPLSPRENWPHLTSIPEMARVRRNGTLVGSILSFIYRYYFGNYVHYKQVGFVNRRRPSGTFLSICNLIWYQERDEGGGVSRSIWNGTDVANVVPRGGDRKTNIWRANTRCYPPIHFQARRVTSAISISMTLKYMRGTSVKRWEINSKYGLFYFRLDESDSI